jgi:hypothetical protein
MLGFVASFIAIGGAFASSTLVLGKYVKVTTAPTCRAIVDVECGNPGQRTCQAIINGTTYNVYSDAACTNLVTTQLTTPIPTSFE